MGNLKEFVKPISSLVDVKPLAKVSPKQVQQAIDLYSLNGFGGLNFASKNILGNSEFQLFRHPQYGELLIRPVHEQFGEIYPITTTAPMGQQGTANILDELGLYHYDAPAPYDIDAAIRDGMQRHLTISQLQHGIDALIRGGYKPIGEGSEAMAFERDGKVLKVVKSPMEYGMWMESPDQVVNVARNRLALNNLSIAEPMRFHGFFEEANPRFPREKFYYPIFTQNKLKSIDHLLDEDGSRPAEWNQVKRDNGLEQDPERRLLWYTPDRTRYLTDDHAGNIGINDEGQLKIFDGYLTPPIEK